jgi:glycosyltransferase involved in cell wall biosynthesis
MWEEMVALSKALGLEDMVEFTGRVPDEFVQRCLSTADVCLSPDPKNPLNDVSTMNKVLEYMAMGRPVVSFDLTEARVSAGDAAVYARADDEAEFAVKIDLLLRDEELRDAMGRRGRQRVETSLSWEHSRRALVEFYDRFFELRAQRSGRAWPVTARAAGRRPSASRWTHAVSGRRRGR